MCCFPSNDGEKRRNLHKSMCVIAKAEGGNTKLNNQEKTHGDRWNKDKKKKKEWTQAQESQGGHPKPRVRTPNTYCTGCGVPGRLLAFNDHHFPFVVELSAP